MKKVFKTTATTSIHGSFPVEISIDFNGTVINPELCECFAKINGIEYKMQYNVRTAPRDQIGAGYQFAKEVGCDVGRSIRCEAGEVSDFINSITAAAIEDTYMFEKFSRLHDDNNNA